MHYYCTCYGLLNETAFHSTFRGQSPAEADLNLLETARRCELYGTKLHTSKVRERSAAKGKAGRIYRAFSLLS